MTDDVTEVRMQQPHPLYAVTPDEFEAFRAYTDLVTHHCEYAEGSAIRRLRIADQLMMVVDQMWSMLPRYEDDPTARPQELDARIQQLRNYLNTEHSLNGRRRG